jgi:hypothetical protein
MPSFKPKNIKKIKISKKNATTLDGTHTEFINDFSKDKYNTIPKLKTKKTELLSLLENKDESSRMTIEQIMDIKD